MKRKIFTLLIFSLISLIVVPSVVAQNLNYEEYGYTKLIDSKRGKEYSQNQTQKIAFSENYLYFPQISIFGGWTQQYGEFSHYQNGNKIYKAKMNGVDIRGYKVSDSASEFAYFVVSSDNSIVNAVSTNNVGEPVSIKVYRKANTEIIEQIYR